MAYNRSSDFDFDGNDPGPGGFFHQRFESGKVMVGWGRPRRSKWVQLDQAEIANFLGHVHEFVVTDDQAVKDLLGQLAEALTESQPRFEKITDLTAEAASRWAELLGQGTDPEEALAKVNAEFAETVDAQ